MAPRVRGAGFRRGLGRRRHLAGNPVHTPRLLAPTTGRHYWSPPPGNRRLPPLAAGGPGQCPMPSGMPHPRALRAGGWNRQMVEAAGIEPASRDAPSWASTRVVRRLMSSAPLRRTGSALTSSTVSRRGWAEQPPHDQPAVLRLDPPQARRPQRHYLVLRQRGSSACWHLVCSSRIYEVPGPRRATQVESASGRSRSPPCRAFLIDERRSRGKGRVGSCWPRDARPFATRHSASAPRVAPRSVSAASGSRHRSTCASPPRTPRVAPTPACDRGPGSNPTTPTDRP